MSTAEGSILVVDDEETVRRTLTTLLAIENFTVETAGHGGEALNRLLQGQLPDVVLMDLMMPTVDGLTALRWIRANPATAATPVVVLSAKADPVSRRLAEAAGADAYVTKPFDVDVLLAVIRSAMVDVGDTLPAS
ncbi:MAG TPA: response regulator [Acidimicrobiales bacterium]|nr:response regulator [Acidimicrobiales bacterium]